MPDVSQWQTKTIAMLDSDILEAGRELQPEWGLQLTSEFTEAEILLALAHRIAQIIAQGPDAFFTLMYRLDISEGKLRRVMHDIDAPDKIARLILERQLQKVRSRNHYKNNGLDTDPDLQW
jgi:hypothetical protein